MFRQQDSNIIRYIWVGDFSLRKKMRVSCLVLSFVLSLHYHIHFKLCFLTIQLLQFSKVIGNGMIKLSSGRFRLNGRSSKVTTDADRVEAESYKNMNKYHFPPLPKSWKNIVICLLNRDKNLTSEMSISRSYLKVYVFYIDSFFI